ncbi:MAG: nucleotidyltransferase family protein [Tissierellia bacterium]|nr:nucleotidyltransferase family protein [Tissierellia bacterium]
MKNSICGVVVSAGLSSRMGQFKPLLPYGGTTVIESVIGSLLSGGAQRVILVLGHRGGEIEASLKGSPHRDHVDLVYNRDYRQSEMIDSYRMGLAQAVRYEMVLLQPGDMPAVNPEIIKKLITLMVENSYEIVYPSNGTRRLHPALIRGGFIPAILDRPAPMGLGKLLTELSLKTGYLLTEDRGNALDLDTMEDYFDLLRKR